MKKCCKDPCIEMQEKQNNLYLVLFAFLFYYMITNQNKCFLEHQNNILLNSTLNTNYDLLNNTLCNCNNK